MNALENQSGCPEDKEPIIVLLPARIGDGVPVTARRVKRTDDNADANWHNYGNSEWNAE